MKILHINTYDINGGAARAAYRLHRALLAEDVDSQMLVQSKSSDDYTVLSPFTRPEQVINKLRPVLDSLPVKLNKDKYQSLFSPAWLSFSQVPKYIDKINPDIVHLHWIAGGMISIKDLNKISKPMVWSLHDMWAFTGGEHYIEDESVITKSIPVTNLSKRGFDRKKSVYNNIDNMTIIGLSDWMHILAKNSQLLSDKKHVCLPNPMDTNKFSPFNKSHARELLNLQNKSKIILFGAMTATSDPRKGYNELIEALSNLPKDYECIVFGSLEPQDNSPIKQQITYLGHLHDDISLKVLYSAADVMVVPSIQENLSNAIIESLACGTPVVGFNIGGNGDMIDHKVNGYLAKPYDTKDLANGIEWILNADNYDELCSNARQKVVTHFDSKIVARQYIDLYKEILNK